MDSRKKSQRQEKQLAAKFGGRTRPGSGSLWGAKGDVRNEKFLIEAKRTESDHYRISSRVWNKIRKEAIRDGLREPLYAIQIQDLNLIAIDRHSPVLESRDKYYKLLGVEMRGDVTYQIEKSWWSMRLKPNMLQAAVVNIHCKDDESGEHLKFKLLVMKEEDFFKLVNMV